MGKSAKTAPTIDMPVGMSYVIAVRGLAKGTHKVSVLTGGAWVTIGTAKSRGARTETVLPALTAVEAGDYLIRATKRGTQAFLRVHAA